VNVARLMVGVFIMQKNMDSSSHIILVGRESYEFDKIDMTLRTAGYMVEKRSYAPDICVSIENDDFDLAMVDLSEKPEGIDILLETLIEHLPDIQTIIITENGELNTISKALKNGIFDYLRRPFDNEELLKRVEIALDHKLLRDQKAQAELEKRKLIAQLFQARKMESLGRMAGGAAIDFDELLEIIIGNTEAALNDSTEWDYTRHNLQEVQKASLRAKELVKRLMSVYRKGDSCRLNEGNTFN